MPRKIQNVAMQLSARDENVSATLTKIRDSTARTATATTNLDNRFRSLSDGLRTFAGAAVVGLAVRGITQLASRFAETRREFQELAHLFDSTPGQIERLSFAFRNAFNFRGDIEDILGSVSDLSIRLSEAQEGVETYATAFARLNIDLDKFARLDPVSRFERFVSLAGDESFTADDRRLTADELLGSQFAERAGAVFEQGGQVFREEMQRGFELGVGLQRDALAEAAINVSNVLQDAESVAGSGFSRGFGETFAVTIGDTDAKLRQLGESFEALGRIVGQVANGLNAFLGAATSDAGGDAARASFPLFNVLAEAIGQTTPEPQPDVPAVPDTRSFFDRLSDGFDGLIDTVSDGFDSALLAVAGDQAAPTVAQTVQLDAQNVALGGTAADTPAPTLPPLVDVFRDTPPEAPQRVVSGQISLADDFDRQIIDADFGALLAESLTADVEADVTTALEQTDRIGELGTLLAQYSIDGLAFGFSGALRESLRTGDFSITGNLWMPLTDAVLDSLVAAIDVAAREALTAAIGQPLQDFFGSVFGTLFGGGLGGIPSSHEGSIVGGPAGSDQLRLVQSGQQILTRSDQANIRAIGQRSAAPFGGLGGGDGAPTIVVNGRLSEAQRVEVLELMDQVDERRFR